VGLGRTTTMPGASLIQKVSEQYKCFDGVRNSRVNNAQDSNKQAKPSENSSMFERYYFTTKTYLPLLPENCDFALEKGDRTNVYLCPLGSTSKNWEKWLTEGIAHKDYLAKYKKTAHLGHTVYE